MITFIGKYKLGVSETILNVTPLNISSNDA